MGNTTKTAMHEMGNAIVAVEWMSAQEFIRELVDLMIHAAFSAQQQNILRASNTTKTAMHETGNAIVAVEWMSAQEFIRELVDLMIHAASSVQRLRASYTAAFVMHETM